MSSGNFWAAIGGAFGAASDVLNEQRKQREMQAYQEKLRKQELEDFQKKEQIRAEIERKNRAGQSRQIFQSPTGELINVGYDNEGRGLAVSSIGTIPGVEEERRRQMEAEAIKEQREQEKHESALSRDASTRYRNNEAALTSRARRENPELFRSGRDNTPSRSEQRTERLDRLQQAAQEEGMVYDKNKGVFMVTGRDGRSRPVDMSKPEEREKVERARRKASFSADASPEDFLAAFQ